jgi:hypothetical protein
MRAQSLLNAWSQQQNITPTFSYVFPEPFGPQRFHGVVREEEGYRSVVVHTFSGRIEDKHRIQISNDNPTALAIRQTPTGQKFDWFFKAPVWRPLATNSREAGEQPAAIWYVYDLRFESEVLNRGNPFVYRFDVAANRIEYVGATRR